MRVRAKYYDGLSSKEKDVILDIDKDSLEIKELKLKYPLKEVDIFDKVGNNPRVIDLPNGGRIKIESNKEVDNILKNNSIFKIENSKKGVIFILIASIFLVYFFFTKGSDFAASLIANNLSKDKVDFFSKKAFSVIDEKYLSPSKLPLQIKIKILERFKKAYPNDHFRIIFRSSKTIGPNAFALPNGDIVLLDELVKLDDDKNYNGILGVLLHEKGHVVYKHALKGVVKGVVATALVSYLSGDLSFIVTTLPTLLIVNGYSREFEKEADSYTKKELQRLNISPIPLVKLFKKLDRYSNSKDDKLLKGWLSTHPQTSKRIEFFLKN